MVKSVFGPKSVLGLAAATMLAAAVMPSAPASAAPIRNAPGIAEHQSGVETVQYRRYNRRYYRGPVVRRGFYGPGPYAYGGGPYYYGSPYAYAAPYPYYRRGYYGPRPFIGIGPFGFGVW
jgi:hypothetical protein